MAKPIDCKRTADWPKACPQPLQPPGAANDCHKHAAGIKMPGRCSSDWARAMARAPFEVSCADCQFFLDPAAQAPGPFSFGRRGGGRNVGRQPVRGGRTQRKTLGLVVHLSSQEAGQAISGSSWLYVSSSEAKRGDLPFGKSPDDRHLAVFVLGFA